MVLKDGTKMSKSKGNTVDPQEMIEEYGADTVRLFILFTAPPEQSLEWNDQGVEGAFRFLKRLWVQVQSHAEQGTTIALDTSALSAEQKALRLETHSAIKQASNDYQQRYKFNTAIAAMMKLSNAVAKFKANNDQDRAVVQEALDAIVLCLAPIVPHISTELWSVLGHENALINATWPVLDEAALTRDEIELVVQVNGKVRAKLPFAADASKESIEQLALTHEVVQKWIADKTVRKVIVVPGKLVNVVAN